MRGHQRSQARPTRQTGQLMAKRYRKIDCPEARDGMIYTMHSCAEGDLAINMEIRECTLLEPLLKQLARELVERPERVHTIGVHRSPHSLAPSSLLN